MLFIEAQKLGTLVDRTRKEFSNDAITKITSTYHAWRDGNGYADDPGFCKSAKLEEIRRHNFVLTSGRDVGAADVEDDNVPFAERFAALRVKLDEQFAEAPSAFVACILSSDEFVGYADRTSGGTKMPRTSWEAMGGYNLCLPPVGLRQAFQSISDPWFRNIIGCVHETRALATTRELLIPKLMSGEIRMKDAERIGEAAQ